MKQPAMHITSIDAYPVKMTLYISIQQFQASKKSYFVQTVGEVVITGIAQYHFHTKLFTS
jgi:hypothetical protein